MSDELNDLPEVPELEPGDSQGDIDDSDAPSEPEPTTEPSGPIKLNVDLDKTVEGRALKSVLQQETAQERKMRLAVEAENARLKAEMALTRQALAQAVSPDQLPLIEQTLRAQSDQEELNRLRYQVQVAEFREDWENKAREAGIDPKSDEFQSVLNDTLANPQAGTTELAVTIRLAKHGIGVKKEEPVAKKGTPQEGRQRVEDDYALPPGGGHRADAKAKLMADYQKEIAANQGEVRSLFAIKMKYKKLGLDID